MDPEGLRELLAPLGPVTVRRMFGAAGVFADGLCFAIAIRGELYLKTDEETRAAFAAAGSAPFIYERRGVAREMSFWRLVAEAYDDVGELKHWGGLALAAARRAAAKPARVKRAQAKKRAPR
jgi:DNA transformation protein